MAADEAELLCPHCRYDLRGTTEPRCPECGTTFDERQWASGVLRDSLPAALDGCDLWQPHAVLAGSLRALLRGLARPRTVLTQTRITGTTAAAVLTLLGGLAWLYVLAVVLNAAAALLHEPVSPATALRAAAWEWVPRELLVAIVAGAFVFGLVARPDTLRIAKPAAGTYFRVACQWVPGAAGYVLLPYGVTLLAVPELAFGVPYVFPILAGVPALRAWTGRDRSGRAEPTAQARVIAAWAAVAWVVVTPWLAIRLLPGTLEPGAGVYF